MSRRSGVGLGVDLLAAAEHAPPWRRGRPPCRWSRPRGGRSARICSAWPARTRPGIAPRGTRRRCRPGHRRAVRGMSSREPCPHRAGGSRPAQGDPGGQGARPRPGGPDFLTASACGAGGRGARRQRLKRAFPGLADERRGGSIGWKRLHLGSTPSRHRARSLRHGLLRRGTAPARRAETPGPGCFPSRRSVRRRARGRVIPPAGHRSGRPRMPARARARTDSRQTGFIRRDAAAQRRVSVQMGPGQLAATREILIAVPNRRECCRRRPPPPRRTVPPRGPRPTRLESPGIVHDRS